METQGPKSPQSGEEPNDNATKIPINPIDAALRFTYGFGLPPTREDTTQAIPDKSAEKKDSKIRFEEPDVIVQRLMLGQPLYDVEKKVGENTAKETFTAPGSQPAPEPEPTAVPVPVNQEAVQVDHDRMIRFYKQLEKASENIDAQANVLNLKAIKGLAGFKDVDTAIQDLASEYSRDDFDLQDHHLLRLEEISEKLATELEETNGWDKTVHQDNVAAVGVALNIEITSRTSRISGLNQADEAQAEAVSIPSKVTNQGISPEASKTVNKPIEQLKPDIPIIIPDNTLGNNFEKALNHILESSQNPTEQIGVSPDVLIQYLKHAIKFPRGVGFHGIPSAKIEKREGKNILITKGSIRGGIGPIIRGKANFTITLGNNDQEGVEMIDKSIEYFGEATKNKAAVEDRLGRLNQTIIDQVNGRLNQFWEVANFRINDDKIIFDFRRK